MAELFPRSILAGMTLEHRVVTTYHAAPEWTLRAILRGPGHIDDLQAVHDGRNHVFRASAAATAQWLPGEYVYSLRATDEDGVVMELDSGTVLVRPDISMLPAAGYDARSHVARVLDAIEAVIEKRATLDQEEYRINNRELKRTPIGDLLRLRDRYRAELRRMTAARSGSLFSRPVRAVFR